MSLATKERILLALLCLTWFLSPVVLSYTQNTQSDPTPIPITPLAEASSPAPDEPNPEPVATETPVPDHEIETVAKILWNEARGIPSDTEVACVAWTIVNRVDAGYGADVVSVATAPGQYAYDPDAPLDDRLLCLAEDVLHRWYNGGEGRVLPSEYMWFQGDGKHNWFRNAYTGGDVWDYSATSPYES